LDVTTRFATFKYRSFRLKYQNDTIINPTVHCYGDSVSQVLS